MIHPWRRVAAAAVAATLLALVACDLCVGVFRRWWNHHSLTASVVSSLLVLAVTALIVDEVVARRQRKERAVSVAAQGLIVYGQAQRTHDAIVDSGPEEQPGNGPDELRTLGVMMLTASPSFFEDPAARSFLGQAERCSASMLRTLSKSSGAEAGVGVSADDRARLAAEMTKLKTAFAPLLERIPAEDRALLEGEPQA